MLGNLNPALPLSAFCSGVTARHENNNNKKKKFFRKVRDCVCGLLCLSQGGSMNVCVCRKSLPHFYLSIEQTSHHFQIRLHMLNSLTVSHLARARSSSNLANSRLSWMVTSNFHISRAAKPRNKIAPATDRSSTKMSGPLGQSGWKEEDRND